ncbi:MAG: PDZ domain-containing protein [Oligoflexales bacterium]|nr:PDZ domain-containing protein [Oligoflexales bacterium]
MEKFLKSNRFFHYFLFFLFMNIVVRLVNQFSYHVIPQIKEKGATYSYSQVSRVHRDREKITKKKVIELILYAVKEYHISVGEERYFERNLAKKILSQIHLKYNLNYVIVEGMNFAILDLGSELRSLFIPDVVDLDYLVHYINELSEDLDVFFASKEKKPDPESKARENKPLIASINGLLSVLDDHSSVLSAASYRDLRESTEGNFGGLGIMVSTLSDVLTVSDVFPKSPAERAGVLPKDKILSIDGVSTFNFDLDDLVNKMRGDPGSAVNLFLLSEGAMTPRVVKLVRETIQLNSVEPKVIEEKNGKILLIRINSFSIHTSDEVKLAVLKFFSRSLDNKGNILGIILDLRSNPGGLLDQAVKTADIFLDKGLIVSTYDRKSREVESATKSFLPLLCPISVLIDQDSASSSEILAAALQENGRAFVVGAPSYGKGSVQTIFELPDEMALKLTIAGYLTPTGRSIHGLGVVPDIELVSIVKKNLNENIIERERDDHEMSKEKRIYESQKGDVSKSFYKSLFKSYVLKDDLNKLRGNEKIDPDVLVSSFVFQTWPDRDRPKFKWKKARDSLLAMSEPLKDFLKKIEEEADSYLVNKHKISWLHDETPNDSELGGSLSSRIVSLNKHRVSKAESILAKIEIKNNSAQEIDRVSVFIKPYHSDRKFEKLIQHLAPYETRLESIEFSSTSFAEGMNFIDSYISVDADLVSDFSETHDHPSKNRSFVFVEKSENPNLIVSSSLVGEGASQDGLIEAKEKAVLKIRVLNDGDHPLNLNRFSLLNLSGEQVDLKTSSEGPKLLRPHEERFFYADLLVPNIKDETLRFGLIIDGNQFQSPYKKTLEVHAKSEKE